ncbi:phage holin family protein [Agromyces bauzanensis]
MGSDPTVGVPRHVDPDTTPSEQQAANTSLGDLLTEVSRDISTLMRQEVELAKAELRQTATRAGKGAGMYGGAGVAGWFTLLFLSIALWWALGYVMSNAWSAVLVAAIWAVVAVVLYFVGKREFDEVRGMPDTVESVKKIPEALKRNEENR